MSLSIPYIDDLAADIQELISRAESGEEWAEICRLEKIMIDALRQEGSGIGDDDQFGVGA